LIQLAELYETPDFIVGDPSWWMHQVDGERNQEATAFVASVLSYGSRAQFMPKIGQLLDYAEGDMDRWLRTGAYAERFAIGDKQCFYRLYNNDTMRRLFDAYRDMLLQHGSMGTYVSGTALQAVESICRWFAEHGVSVVVPKNTTSACKRVCMFLRWMVRDGSPVDLGLWKGIIDKCTLIMPLDTHVVSEAMKLGLLQSRCASMNAALRLTDTMREAFPDDPLKGDFALFGYGVSE
jgi:uncharacterized protein (TIGR02757 family)